MKLVIGHLSTFYHTAILLMAKSGLSNALGADVEWRLFGTGPAIVKAFERKEINLAYIGLPPAIIGIERGVPIRCIAGGHIEGTVISGLDRFMGYPEIKDLGAILNQFAGMKIGVPGKGSIHDVIIHEYLDRLGLNNDIEVKNYTWSDQITESAVKGEIAAAIGTPALAAAVMRYAGGKVLYPPSKTWPYNPSYGILADTDLIETETELLEHFLFLHEEKARLLRDRPGEAAEIISKYVGFIDSEFVFQVLGISPRYCAQLTDKYLAASMEFARTLRRLGYITRDVSREEIFDPSLIRRVHQEEDHY